MKKITIAALAALALTVMTDNADAQLRPSPTPILVVAPTFSCGVTVNGTSGMATITHTNATAVNKTTDVVATIQTPSGKVSASVCGSVFSSGTQGKVSWNVPTTTDKSYIYTCTAVQTTQTFACNPPK